MRRPIYRPTYLLTADGLAADVDPAAEAKAEARDAATQAAMSQSSDAQQGETLAAETRRMKRAMIESISKTIAAQVAIMIATQIMTTASLYAVGSVIPVIGWIIDAVMALISLVSAPYIKAQTKEITANAKNELIRYAQDTMDAITQYAYSISEDEFPAAQQLALSNTALDGWFGEAFTDIVRSIAKPVAKPFAKAHTLPIKLVGKGILKGGAAIARASGNQEVEYKFNAQERKWEEKQAWADKTTTAMAADPVMAIRVLHTAPFKMLSGLQQLDVIRAKSRELVKKGRADLDTYKANSMAVFDAPDYRTKVRVALAKAIRANPILQTQAAAAVAVTGPGTGATAPSSAPKSAAPSAGGMLSFAAIVGYFLLHK